MESHSRSSSFKKNIAPPLDEIYVLVPKNGVACEGDQYYADGKWVTTVIKPGDTYKGMPYRYRRLKKDFFNF